MTAFNHDGSNKEFDMMEAKSEENGQHSSGNTDHYLVKMNKLKASSTEKGTTYDCKGCGKQMANQSSLNVHIRSIQQDASHINLETVSF